MEMYIDIAKCLSEMADTEIDRIAQISKVIIFYSTFPDVFIPFIYDIKICLTPLLVPKLF